MRLVLVLKLPCEDITGQGYWPQVTTTDLSPRPAYAKEYYIVIALFK